MTFSIWQYVYYNSLTGFNVTKFEIKVIFLIRLFCYMTKNSRQKELFRWNKKYFSSFVKGFQLPKIVPDLRVCLRGKKDCFHMSCWFLESFLFSTVFIDCGGDICLPSTTIMSNVWWASQVHWPSVHLFFLF